MKPYYDHGGITIYHGDCRDVLPGVAGVALVATDPPYQGVVAEWWDNQWGNDGDFLAWMDSVFGLVDHALADNGTVYAFSSPRLAARLEVQIAQRFAILGGAVWDKGDGRKGAAGSGIDVGSLRTYWAANTERVIVAEKRLNGAYREADDKARASCGYWEQCDAAKRSIFGVYLRAEFARAGKTQKQIAALFPSKTGGLTGCVSNWLLGLNVPTPDQYQAMRSELGADYLRREYDDLRREYDDLRRPFFLSVNDQWTDVWRFAIERERLHPTQKPLALMTQIVRVSSRVGDVALDPFMGSGTTLVAAKALGRRAIGIEIEERYCEIAARRLSQEVLPLFGGAA